jgi:MFS transporter, OFA family, oxalate/formate antiporter
MRMPFGFSNATRLKVAAAGFCMQLALGAVYGWSVFLTPLQQHFGASKVATNLTFTITLAVLGITAGFGGALLRQIGPRATATMAGLLYGVGVLLSGFAPNLTVLYLTYGLLGGAGLGLGYIVPLAVLIGWFPDKCWSSPQSCRSSSTPSPGVAIRPVRARRGFAPGAWQSAVR